MFNLGSEETSKENSCSYLLTYIPFCRFVCLCLNLIAFDVCWGSEVEREGPLSNCWFWVALRYPLAGWLAGSTSALEISGGMLGMC